jgi:hypothetical protein
MFISEAIIVLRTSRTQSTVFDLNGFINDFKNFIKRADVKETGFVENILKMKSSVIGDIAQSFVLYEAYIPGSGREPQIGIDNFSLIYKNNRWLIVSITNEIPTVENPLPEKLFNQ